MAYQVGATRQRIQHVLDGVLNGRHRLADGSGRLRLHEPLPKLSLLRDVLADPDGADGSPFPIA